MEYIFPSKLQVILESLLRVLKNSQSHLLKCTADATNTDRNLIKTYGTPTGIISTSIAGKQNE